jgi:FMN phosphatase YigB (HAD superfamily)
VPQTSKQTVSLVIFDLDNTLWDWVGIWYASFSTLLENVAAISDLEPELLKREFKAIHQKYGTAEYSYAIEELPCLRAKHGDDANLRALYNAAIERMREVRRPLLKPYPDVVETLETLKDRGCLLVGYTESLAYYSAFRLRQTGLDRVLDFLYSPADHVLPTNLTVEQKERHFQNYELRRTVHRHTPKGELKPNPKVLLDIIREVGGTPEQSIYIGDSEFKDIATAKAANVTDVWAKYGVAARNGGAYALLKEVTHWSDADVAREREVDERAKDQGVQPTFVLDTGFSQVLDLFRFIPFKDSRSDRATLAFTAWEKTVDVQQHFNDLEMTIRNFAITLFAGVIGAIGLCIKDGLEIHIGPVVIPAATIVGFLGAGAWMMFYFMDQHWYHVFLRAAGQHAKTIETRWASLYPEIELSTRISEASTYQFPRWKPVQSTWTSTQRLRLFYYTGAVVLILIGLLAIFIDAREKPDDALNVRVAGAPKVAG